MDFYDEENVSYSENRKYQEPEASEFFKTFNSLTDRSIVSQNHLTKEELKNLIITTINKKILFLENKMISKDKEIYDLMFTVHSMKLEIESTKENFNKISSTKYETSHKKNLSESFNKSILTAKSSIFSNNNLSSKSAKKRVSILPTQKVSINIDTSNKNYLSSESVKEARILEKNLKPNLSNKITKHKNSLFLETVSISSKIKLTKNTSRNKTYSPSLVENSFGRFSNLFKTNHKFEPKKKLKANSLSENNSNTLGKFTNNSKQIIYSKIEILNVNTGNTCNIENKIYKVFNESSIITNIFKFLEDKKSQLILKNFSKLSRKVFFEYEISLIENKIKNKIQQQNPFNDFESFNFEYKLILSDYRSKQSELCDGFVLLINILYIILFKKESKDEIDKNISEIESLVGSDKNIYSKYHNLISTLKSNSKVQTILKGIRNSFYKIKNFFSSLSNEDKVTFNMLEVLFNSITKLVNKQAEINLLIETEILNHKLEQLITFKNAF